MPLPLSARSERHNLQTLQKIPTNNTQNNVAGVRQKKIEAANLTHRRPDE
jgi:hypothetical protein